MECEICGRGVHDGVSLTRMNEKGVTGIWRCKDDIDALAGSSVTREGIKSTLTPDDQLEQWVAGESLCPNTRGECCPDFSCCTPELLADYTTRRAFLDATDESRMSFLGMFLGAAFEKAGNDKVYISGDTPTETH